MLNQLKFTFRKTPRQIYLQRWIAHLRMNITGTAFKIRLLIQNLRTQAKDLPLLFGARKAKIKIILRLKIDSVEQLP